MSTHSILPSNLSYHRLKQELDFDDDDVIHHHRHHAPVKSTRTLVAPSPRKWLIRKLKRVRIRTRLRFRVGSVRRVLRIGSRVGVARRSWMRLCRRLKESQSHLGDLFAGNYLFMQVTPTSLKKKSNKVNHSACFVGPHYKFNPPRLPLGLNNYGINTYNKDVV